MNPFNLSFSSVIQLLIFGGICGSVSGAQADERPSALAVTKDVRLIHRYFRDHFIVDGHIEPRVWFGCCADAPGCRSSDASEKTSCQLFGPRLKREELYRELGANIGFEHVSLPEQKSETDALKSPLKNSNQLGFRPVEASFLTLYFTDLPLSQFSSPRHIAQWSKYQHLAGIRGIRLVDDRADEWANIDESSLKKGFSLLAERFFLIDLGSLTGSNFQRVLDLINSQKHAVLFTGGHLGGRHACLDKNRVPLSPDQACQIASNGGVITIGVTRFGDSNTNKGCSGKADVDAYFIQQFQRFMSLSCDGGEHKINMNEHLGIATINPLKEVSTFGNQNEVVPGRWHHFVPKFAEVIPEVSTVTGVLGENLIRLIRRRLPGVQPAKLLFPVDGVRLSDDKAIQFQWLAPQKNDPARMAGQIQSMRHGDLVIEKQQVTGYVPWRTEKVVSGDRKTLVIRTGNFRWRLVSKNRKNSVSTEWAYFSVYKTVEISPKTNL